MTLMLGYVSHEGQVGDPELEGGVQPSFEFSIRDFFAWGAGTWINLTSLDKCKLRNKAQLLSMAP